MTPEQEKILREVHSAIVGNPVMGHKGLVQRMAEVEDYQNKDSKFKNKIVVWCGVGTTVLVCAWELFKWKYI